MILMKSFFGFVFPGVDPERGIQLANVQPNIEEEKQVKRALFQRPSMMCKLSAYQISQM
jgi:hypothetical protein